MVKNIMVKVLLLILVSNILCQTCFASDDFTLYFVRHAEKASSGDDPGLTRCGKERANQLSRLLATADIKSIYSTSYQRTMSTAAPLSRRVNVSIKNYSPVHLEEFSLQLSQTGENALIVGHSNTTADLVRILSNKDIAKIAEDEYSILYQVQFVNNQTFLTAFTQPLICN